MSWPHTSLISWRMLLSGLSRTSGAGAGAVLESFATRHLSPKDP